MSKTTPEQKAEIELLMRELREADERQRKAAEDVNRKGK